MVENLQALPQQAPGPVPEGTLWHAVGKPMTGIGAGRYRLDERFLYFEEGALRTNSQQLLVADITDVDIKQSMTQKARGVYTVIVHVGGQVVKLEDIEDGHLAQRRINDAAYASRIARDRHQSTVRYEGTYAPHQPQVHVVQTPAAATEPAAPAAGGDDLMEKLTKLAELRTDGLLSENEFIAAKAKLLE